jgi:hypothetical protein
MQDSSAGYVVKDIEGLNPVKATLTSSTLAQVDGAQFQNARRDPRNITISVGIEPDYVTNTVQSLRDALYSYFTTKAIVDLGFYLDDVLYVVTSGQVESCENSMFSADPQVDISVLCYDPDFYVPEMSTLSSETVPNTNANMVDYEGTTDTGVIFTLNVDRDLSSFTLYNIAPDGENQQFTVSNATFMDGDVVTVNTVPGFRGLTLTRAGVISSVLYWADPFPGWITLKKGINQFRCYALGAGVSYDLTYTAKIGGI